MGIFFKIVLPLSKAALASIGLMFAVTFWNDYTNFKLYINKNNLYNFQIQLRSMVVDSDILMMVLLTQQQFLMQQLSWLSFLS